MNTINLIRELYLRGVVFEPCGDRLAVDPVERLEPEELETIREHKQEILGLFKNGRLRLVECPGDECPEVLFVIDGMAHCKRHGMSVRFVEMPQ